VQLNAAEISSVSGRQMAELNWKFCGELFVFEGIKFCRIIWMRISEGIKGTGFNV